MNDQERFDKVMNSLSEEDQTTLLISCNDAIGPTGYGPNEHFGQGTENKYKELGLSDEDVAFIESQIEKEKEGRQLAFWASQAYHMGEVPDEEGWGTRYATKEEYERAKEILGIEEDEDADNQR